MRQSRLLSILLMLQARGSLSAATLAAEFEVSTRTIHRDMDELSAAGVPVYAERGRHGGFRLRDGYRTRLTGLQRAEAESLLLAGVPAAARQLGLADALSAARLKLLAALPADLRQGAERIASRFHLDAGAWFHEADRPPALPAIARAVWEERMLMLRYRPAGKQDARPRKLAPLGLVLKGGVWYLVARNGKSIRSYRASNISDVQVCDERFARPLRFDLAGHWEMSVRNYETGLLSDHAEILLSPLGLQRITVLGPLVASAAAVTAGKPDSRGWVRCRLPLEAGEFGMRELLRLGDEAVVVAPPALRAKMKNLAMRIAQLHAA